MSSSFPALVLPYRIAHLPRTIFPSHFFLTWSLHITLNKIWHHLCLKKLSISHHLCASRKHRLLFATIHLFAYFSFFGSRLKIINSLRAGPLPGFFSEVSLEFRMGPGTQKVHNKYLFTRQKRSSWQWFLVITFHCCIQLLWCGLSKSCSISPT